MRKISYLRLLAAVAVLSLSLASCGAFAQAKGKRKPAANAKSVAAEVAPVAGTEKAQPLPWPPAPSTAGQATPTGVAAVVAGVEMPAVSPGQPITLDLALAKADERNLTLSAARLELTKADAQLSQSYALVLPMANASLQYMRFDHATTFNLGSTLPPELSAMAPMGDTVLQPQDDLKGKVEIGISVINAQSWATIAVAKRGVAVARAGVEDGRQQLLHGVAQAYYMALMARELITLNEDQIKSATHHLEVSKARFDAGTGLRIDVIRAETDLEKAHQDLLSSHLSFDNARDAIGMLTGLGGLPTPIETKDIPVPTGNEKDLVDRAGKGRSDIQMKQAMIELHEKQLDASWMQFLPTLTAGWGMQYQFTKPGDMGDADRSRWSAVFTLSVPIYRHDRYADLDYKRAVLRQAELQAEDKRENVAIEVRRAHRDYLAALSSVNIAQRQAALAGEGLTLVEASYEAGTGSSLDITDARRTVQAANVNLAAKRLEAQIALLGLLRSVGENMYNISK